jgi:hypothetical protein
MHPRFLICHRYFLEQSLQEYISCVCFVSDKTFSIQVSGCTLSEAEKFGVLRAPLHPCSKII